MLDSIPTYPILPPTDSEAQVLQSEQVRFPADGGRLPMERQPRTCFCPIRPVGWRCRLVLALLAVVVSFAIALPAASADEPEALAQNAAKAPKDADAKQDETPTREASTEELEALILRLDAEQFNERNEATRQLVAQGPHCVPLLVTSLGSEAREIRFRASEILRHCFTFDEIAQHLIDAVGAPFGSETRLILRDRALWQVAEAAGMENTTRLFEFWGTDVESLRRRITFELVEARGRDQVAAIVAPLIGMRDKAQLFNSHLGRLESLSLPFDHRHSPGYVIAETLARGLLENDEQKIQFAQDYIGAFTLLVEKLQAGEQNAAAVRKEVIDRANMSDGATCFLARLLDGKSRERQLMQERLGVAPESLKSEFVRGIGLADARECYRCVGKVHIADMLLEALDQWPTAPKDGVVQNIVDCVVTTISSGDKPKSLALLDALEGCKEIESSGLTVHQGLGQQLAKRLCLAALVAPNNRACYPVRAIHDRILKILDSGVKSDSDLWPAEFVESYLEGAEEAISDDGRAKIGRYVNVLQLLHDESEQPGTRQFLQLMCQSVSKSPQLLESGTVAVSQLISDTKKLAAQERRDAIDKALDEWVRNNPL